ncbi:MAG: undecaprenyl-diphosphate phosphatase [Prevotellaceae bacterium]|jgi:undecaprenyl-diphosphatase|nr:undecaprenyl-diphosphate phosphatase [Prevotellaceae bacterium]
MHWIEALLLGLLQGLTEFLPVSSSGHLTVAQELFHLDTSAADNLLFDVMVHTATVCSTLVILRREIAGLFIGSFANRVWNEEKSYLLKLVLSMIPVFIVGFFFKDTVEALFGSGLLLVGGCLILTAALLAFAYYAKQKEKKNISYGGAFIIGLSQALAVLPGLSRSGTTISTGILLGYKKEEVAKFSFLMVLVPILGEALLRIVDMIKDPTAVGSSIGFMPLAIAFVSAFVSGCFACKFMIDLVRRGKLIYFAAYCVVAGIAVVLYSLCK